MDVDVGECSDEGVGSVMGSAASFGLSRIMKLWRLS